MTDCGAKVVTTHFQIEFEVDGDVCGIFTSTWTDIKIYNSIHNCWPVLGITFLVDNQAVIEQQVYGAEDIVMKIYYTDESGEKKDPPVEFKLLYMESNLDLPPKKQDNMTDPRESQRRFIEFAFLPKPAYLVMSAYINRLWEEDAAMRPIDFLYDIFDLRGIDYSQVSEDGVTIDTVYQLLIPPMTIKSAIDYIHEKYPIYEGPMFRYVNYSGQLVMWDLHKKYLTWLAGWTRYHKLPSYSEDETLFKTVNQYATDNPDQFVTYDMASSIHFPNSIIAKYGYDITFIIHPHQDICYFQKTNFPEVVELYGLWVDNSEVKINTAFKNRNVYYTDQKGFEISDGFSGEYSPNFYYTRVSDWIKNCFSVRFSFFKDIKLHYCMKVGEVLYLKPYMEHEKLSGTNYEGAYMIETSELIFTRMSGGNLQDNVKCQCTLTGFRTVQSMD